MSSARNFHVPLPPKVYDQLRQEAERTQQTATSIAKQAIEYWLKQRKKIARQEAIYQYALTVAGSSEDLDPDLETASIEFMLSQEPYQENK